MVGSFDTTGSPIIDIDVFGWNEGVTRTVTAILDTGFTGFLMLPMLTAFPIGLILHSTIEITLADSSTHTKLACWGGIHFGGQTQNGVIMIEGQGTEVLIGIQFLRAFELVLTLDAMGGILLLKPRTTR